MEYQKILIGEEPYFISLVKASYPNHCHNEIELMFCVQGEVEVIKDEKEYLLKKGDILLIDSLSMHQLIIEDDSAIFDIEFGSQLLDSSFHDFAKKSFDEPLIVHGSDKPYAKKLIDYIKKMYKEYFHPDDVSDLAIRGYINQLFVMLYRVVPRHISSNRKRQNQLEKYIKMQKVFDYVKLHYCEKLMLDDIAKLVGYEPNVFCRMFKKVTNMSFHQYLNFYRITLAMHLLEYKTYSIGEIGHQVGIPVAKTFSRLFRAYTGMSPREYRQKINVEIKED